MRDTHTQQMTTIFTAIPTLPRPHIHPVPASVRLVMRHFMISVFNLNSLVDTYSLKACKETYPLTMHFKNAQNFQKKKQLACLKLLFIFP